MSDMNQENSAILLQRIAALEQRERERDSLSAVSLAEKQTLAKEELIKGIFQGTGKPVIVPDRGLKYPKYVAHPSALHPDTKQPLYEIARDPLHEREICERFQREADASGHNGNSHAVVSEPDKPKRGRPAKVKTDAPRKRTRNAKAKAEPPAEMV